MSIEGIISQLPIDDVLSLLKFYSEYAENSYRDVEIKKDCNYIAENEKEDVYFFYFKGRKYVFRSNNSIPIISVMTYNPERMGIREKLKNKPKEKVVGRNKDVLEKALKMLTERARNIRCEIC